MKLPENVLRKWTVEAVLCYLKKCNCSRCYIAKFCETLNSQTCRMKNVVIALVRKFGVPKPEDIEHAIGKIKE